MLGVGDNGAEYLQQVGTRAHLKLPIPGNIREVSGQVGVGKVRTLGGKTGFCTRQAGLSSHCCRPQSKVDKVYIQLEAWEYRSELSFDVRTSVFFCQR